MPLITAVSRFDLTRTRPYAFSPLAEAPTLGASWSCWLCGKPVSLEACKTDEYGKSVHEECYIARLALEKASAQWVAQNIQQAREAAVAGR